MRRLLTAAVLVAIQGCGDGGSSPVASTPSPTPTPQPQPAASLSLTIFRASYVTLGDFGPAYVYFDIGLRETAGTGLAVQRAHLDILRPSGQHVERRTLTQGDIVRSLGENRLEGNETFRGFLTYGVRTSIARGSAGWSLGLTVQYRDDLGNRGEVLRTVELGRWSPL